jgi:hypothetical protein
LLASIFAKLPSSAIAMLIATSVVLYGSLVVCIVLAFKRKP